MWWCACALYTKEGNISLERLKYLLYMKISLYDNIFMYSNCLSCLCLGFVCGFLSAVQMDTCYVSHRIPNTQQSNTSNLASVLMLKILKLQDSGCLCRSAIYWYLWRKLLIALVGENLHVKQVLTSSYQHIKTVKNYKDKMNMMKKCHRVLFNPD